MQKIFITALLFFWPLSALAGTSAGIKYYPGEYDKLLEEYRSGSYSLFLSTDTTNSKPGTDTTSSWRAPAIRFSLQCTGEGQDYYGDIRLEIRHLSDLPVIPVMGMFGSYEGERYPARFTGDNLNISSSWEWIYYERDNNFDPWPLYGNLNRDPATLVRISNALTGSWLRIEMFGFIYDFDLSSVRGIITDYHQKCAVVHGG